MTTSEILDVTQLEPGRKHPTIFKKFDDLAAGESFIIKNDHDPKPLYYQLLANRGNIFQWEYISHGPVWWEIKLSKISKEEALTVGDIVASDIRKAEVFRKYGIDFCCGGKKHLAEACMEKDLDIHALLTELAEASHKPQQNLSHFAEWDLDFLTNYIVQNHHKYVSKAIPEIKLYLNKVVAAHGDAHVELLEIKREFDVLAEELLSHMRKEEEVLFPFILKMVNYRNSGESLSQPHFGTVLGPVKVMEKEHEVAGNIVSEIRTLTADFTPPADACGSYKYLYDQLHQFEDDLHTHVHLENNILFPKAVELEAQLMNDL